MYNFTIFSIILCLVNIISVIISVAFFTLSERKVMAAVQRRRGPDVVGIFGLLQPIADAVKLIGKEISLPSKASPYVFMLAPVIAFILNLLGWAVIPLSVSAIKSNSELNLLFLFPISALSVYGVILAGWSSGSKYALLGAFRSAAQMISYEIVLSVTVIPVVLCSGSLNLTEIILAQEKVSFFIPLLPLAVIFFVSMLAETNRAPFDLPEAEAELVAGFNVEYSSITFALFFLGEYSSMILMSLLCVVLFFGGWKIPKIIKLVIGYFSMAEYTFVNTIAFSIKVTMVCFFYIYVRANLPRYRYDQLMFLGWKNLLPIALGQLVLTLILLTGFGHIFYTSII